MKDYILGCDWGTSSLRLRLIHKLDQQIAGETSSQEGVAKTYRTWKARHEKKGISRKEFFCQQLQTHISQLSASLSVSLDNIPIVISGMASSSVGMEEIPYARLPFAIDGSQASTRHFDRQDTFPHDIILISGVQSQQDVMRGEETQVVGTLALLKHTTVNLQQAMLVFPGTHSKHVYIQDGQVTDFKTFMTGEIFQLMVRHSILRDSVESYDLSACAETDLQAFRLGIKASEIPHMLHGLFTTRTNQLFGKLRKQQNYLYLSGLLIGYELKHLLEYSNIPLVLCSGNNLYRFYQLAIQEMGLCKHTTFLTASQNEQATIAGQLSILHHLHSKNTSQ